MQIKRFDVVINGTGVGTIGRAAPYLHEELTIPDNHVTVLRPKKNSIDPIYLAVFLNSLAGRLQVEKWLRGSSGQIELYPADLNRFLIWLAPEALQKRMHDDVLRSHEKKQESRDLLNSINVAVECLLLGNIPDAWRYLNLGM